MPNPNPGPPTLKGRSNVERFATAPIPIRIRKTKAISLLFLGSNDQLDFCLVDALVGATGSIKPHNLFKLNVFGVNCTHGE